jgi:O-antigen ligase
VKASFINIEDVNADSRPSRLSTAILVLLLCITGTAVMVFGAVDDATWVLLVSLTSVVVLLWLADSWKAGGLIVSPNALMAPLAGLLMIGAVQLLPFGGSTIAGVQTTGSLTVDPYATKAFLARLLIYLVFFGICSSYINNGRRAAVVAIGLVMFGAVLAFLGMLQRVSDPTSVLGIRESTQAIPFGPYVNQHHFAALMNMTSGLALAHLMSADASRQRRVMLAVGAMLMLAAVLFTGSRGGLLAYLSVVAFVVSFKLLNREQNGESVSRGRWLGGALVVIAVVILSIGLVLFLGGDQALLRGIGSANLGSDVSTGRSHFWAVALQIFLAHPLIGTGLETFGVVFPQYDTWSGAMRVEQAHNDYLQMLAEAGLAGISCVAAFVFLLIRGALHTLKMAVGEKWRAMTIGALAGCFGVLIHSFFDFPLRTPANGFVFLLLCCLATIKVVEDEAPRHRSRRRRERAS